MQYKLPIRKITRSDLGPSRPFLPEDENFEMYLSAFVEDVQNLDCVANLEKNGNVLIITVKKESNFEQ